jgi:hypothetical protein
VVAVTVSCSSPSSMARSKAKAFLKSAFCKASRLSFLGTSGPDCSRRSSRSR